MKDFYYLSTSYYVFTIFFIRTPWKCWTGYSVQAIPGTMSLLAPAQVYIRGLPRLTNKNFSAHITFPHNKGQVITQTSVTPPMIYAGRQVQKNVALGLLKIESVK